MQAKKPDFKIFAGGAEDGELHDFPDVTRGWGVTKLQTNKKPPLSWMNGAFNRVDNNFYYLLQNGIAEWSSDIEYSVGALSQVAGVIYRAKDASKGESPAASAKWEKLFADKFGTSDFIGMSQKAVTGALGQPSMTGSATLNGTTDNTVQLTGIVATLGLEVGDVIRIQYTGYNKLHTVESITNNNLIIVNYEHAGNRGNGILKLADKTATVTITRIAKWYNAPVGLGQAWVYVMPNRARNTTYTNPLTRQIMVGLSLNATSGVYGLVKCNGVSLFNLGDDAGTTQQSHTGSFVVSGSGTYIVEFNYADGLWSELR